MAKLISWDTSQKSGVIVAMETDEGYSSSVPYKIKSQWILNVEAFHSEKLLWAIDKTLECCGWSIQEIDAFFVGLGPGSFTGLRIGITTARTMAHSLKKPLIGFSSLSAFAFESLEIVKSNKDEKSTLSLTAIEGAKGQIFIQIGRADHCSGAFIPNEKSEQSIWEKEVIETAIEPEALFKFIKEYKNKYKKTDFKKIVLSGSGWINNNELMNNVIFKNIYPTPFSLFNQISPNSLAHFGYYGFKGIKKSPPLSIKPRYLRASYAEVQRDKKI